MKKSILLLIFLLQVFTFADVSDWTIVNDKGEFWLKNKKLNKLKATITKRTGKSKVVETKPVGKNYELIIYYSGAAGTFHMIDIYYAVIFDKKKRQFVGDFPWKYKSQQGKKVVNPVWNITEKKITIKDEQTALNKTIPLLSN